ncbi:RNA-binding protein 34 [Gastrophryne carolinensis]
MTKEVLKSKPKKAKKLKKDQEESSETKNLVVEQEATSYVAGEVAGSLFPNKPTQSSTALASLFGTKTCAVQPLYVPVVVKKIKRNLEAQVPKQGHTTTATVAPTAKKASKKELTVAEKKVADREISLANADEEERSKNAQDKKNRKKADDDELPLQIKKKVNKAEERVKNKRTVFVGNLPASCTKQMLKSCFRDFGQIESMRFRSMAREDATMSKKAATIQRKINPNRKNINAYVVFKDIESATKALVRNGMEISSGFHIRVDLASKSTSHNNKKSAFVGNLPYDIEEESLRNHFSECGTIEAVRIVRDNKTGIGKGFGYVLFKGADGVHLALKLNNSELLGRKIRVKRCEAQSAQKNTSFKQKPEPWKQGAAKKNTSFMGETADANKSKNKRPRNKPKNRPINKTKNKPINKKKMK